jgi:hypothetical protein
MDTFEHKILFVLIGIIGGSIAALIGKIVWEFLRERKERQTDECPFHGNCERRLNNVEVCTMELKTKVTGLTILENQIEKTLLSTQQELKDIHKELEQIRLNIITKHRED